MGAHRSPGRERPPHQRVKLLVGRTAGAVPGALAGGAVAVGAQLSVLPTSLLAAIGAVLGAIAVTGGREAVPSAREHHAARRMTPSPLDPGHTPPEGIRVEP